jgi:hypothetical protein
VFLELSPCGPNVVDIEPDATSSLRNHCAGLQGVVDALNGVVLHGDEEAGGELRVRCAGVEEGRAGVCEETLRHEVVGLDNAIDIVAVDANGDTHEHVRGSLCNASIDAEEVRSLKCLESEKVVVEIAVVDDGRVENIRVSLDNLVCLLADHGRVLPILRVDCGVLSKTQCSRRRSGPTHHRCRGPR